MEPSSVDRISGCPSFRLISPNHNIVIPGDPITLWQLVYLSALRMGSTLDKHDSYKALRTDLVFVPLTKPTVFHTSLCF